MAPFFARTRGDIKPGTHRMQQLLWFAASHLQKSNLLGDTPLPIGIFKKKIRILVAGTNGKGSVCSTLEEVFRSHGFKTGLYTSPHLVSPTERIRIGGTPVQEKTLEETVAFISNCLPNALPDATFFEILTAAAILLFEISNTEIDIYEVGLGGRLDSTNVIPADISILTSVGFDHVEILGHTLEEIAWEKSFVSRRNKPFITAPLCSEAREGAAVAVRTTGATQRLACNEKSGGENNTFLQDCAPCVTKETLAIVLETLRTLTAEHKLCFENETIRGSLSKVLWPGRFDLRNIETSEGGYPILFDCAHNPAGISFFIEHYGTLAPRLFREHTNIHHTHAPIVIFGSLMDKQWQESLLLLKNFAYKLVLVQPDSPRAVPVSQMQIYTASLVNSDNLSELDDLCELNKLSELGKSDSENFVSSNENCLQGINEALRLAKQCEIPCIMLGSIALIGEAMEMLNLDPFHAP